METSDSITPGTVSPASVSGRAGVFSRRGRLRRSLRRIGVVLIIGFGLLFAGFLRFADSVVSLQPPRTPKADAIVVLTGGYQRIDQALELLEQGAGMRLLISGAHPATSARQLSRLTKNSPDLFSCCVDMGYRALDTIGNAAEAARWIADHKYRSVLVVTNNYHMPRGLLELRRADRATEFIPYPVVTGDLKVKNWFADPGVLRMLLSEYMKVSAATVRDFFGISAGSGLREDVPRPAPVPPQGSS